MRILVLVQSTEKEVYADLLRTQMETWDMIPHPNIEVIYYMASSKPDNLNGNVLSITNTDHITKVFSTFMKSVRHCLNKEWDYILKTDNSVYLVKEKLYELLNSKPREKYYGGVPIVVLAQRDDGFNLPISFMWGEGFIISRDIAIYLVDMFNKAPLKGILSEDIVIGQLLNGYCSWDQIKIHMAIPSDIDDPDGAIYRVRLPESYKATYSPIFGIPDGMNDVIKSDISVMQTIHKIKTNGKDQNNNREIFSEETQS